jgi:hypothetical protein
MLKGALFKPISRPGVTVAMLTLLRLPFFVGSNSLSPRCARRGVKFEESRFQFPCELKLQVNDPQ